MTEQAPELREYEDGRGNTYQMTEQDAKVAGYKLAGDTAAAEEPATEKDVSGDRAEAKVVSPAEEPARPTGRTRPNTKS